MNTRRLRMATITLLVVDMAYIVWGGMAAAMPEGLLGPGGRAILPAAYDGYTGRSWAELLRRIADKRRALATTAAAAR